jgi:hypothetical protein
LALYALVSAMDGHFVRSGWLFGAALAFQPLVLLMAPVLLFMAGWQRALPMALRFVVPAAALLVVPLATGYRATVHAVVDQPTFPLLDHQTPWTALAPRIGGKGKTLKVAGGPIRLLGLALAAGVGARARRWRERPEMLALACAVALALRSYTESVMTAYYVWPVLAVAVVVAARGTASRFAGALTLAVAVTVVAQWHLAWALWWGCVIGGMTLVLAAAARPAPAEEAELAVEPGRLGVWLTDLLAANQPQRPRSGATRPSTSATAARRKRKTARTSRKRTVRR